MSTTKMKYAFLTLLVPKQLEHEVAGCSKRNMQDAANALQWHIYDGLCANFEEKIKLFNILPIGSFPQYYKNAFIKRVEKCLSALHCCVILNCTYGAGAVCALCCEGGEADAQGQLCRQGRRSCREEKAQALYVG